MDTLKAEIAKLFAAKEARRRKLARLPFPEKVRAVLQLQEIAAPVLHARAAEWFACGRWATASCSLGRNDSFKPFNRFATFNRLRSIQNASDKRSFKVQGSMSKNAWSCRAQKQIALSGGSYKIAP